jgi:hypothetical protein
VREPGETESTIRLPRKITRRKSATQAPGAARVTRPLANVDLKDAPREPGETETTIRLPRRELRQLHAAAEALNDAESTIRLPHRAIKRQNEKAQGLATSTLKLPFTRRGARASLEQDLQASFDEMAYEDQDDEVMVRHGTWQKVVEHKTVPISAQAKTKHEPSRLSRLLKRRATRSFFWLSTLVVLALLLSGAFGLAASFGRSVQKTAPNSPPTLLVAPTTVALGGIVTLRGTHFTPGGDVTLSRDQHISLVDTGGQSTVVADAHGAFSDTFVVDPIWLSGTHTLYATDTRTHKQALFPLLVTGQNALQGPPHLVLSSDTLDLGSGDETTSASGQPALSNAGGGIATWQATSNQPWLQIAPQSGSIASGKHLSVTVVADRSALAPGSYQAAITFTSSTGEITLTVKVAVTALQPRHQAIMQLSSGVLDFSGTAHGASPGQQTITITNPGILPLTWGVNVTGSNWLWAAPSGGTIDPGSQQQVTVGAITNGLASGVYKGIITFSNQGSQPVQGMPQSVYVSLTVTPACTLAPSVSSLSFSGPHGGTSPVSKSLSIGAGQGCTTSQSWTAAVSTVSGGKWLNVSALKGATPASVAVSVNTTGLAPGTYSGTLTFTSSKGLKLLKVTLTVTPIPCAISGPSTLALQGTAGQSSLVTQNATISAYGDCQHALSWSSLASGGSWLSASSSGALTSSAAVGIQANLASLSAGTYNGSVTITIVDSVTKQTVGTVVVSVTLTAQAITPPCSLQAASTSSLDFGASAGSDPATPSQSFTLSVTGTCSGDVTITPSALANSGSGWLAVSGPMTIASGSTATFTVTVTSSAQKAGIYTGTITLTAGGIAGSPQTVTVKLTVT